MCRKLGNWECAENAKNGGGRQKGEDGGWFVGAGRRLNVYAARQQLLRPRHGRLRTKRFERRSLAAAAVPWGQIWQRAGGGGGRGRLVRADVEEVLEANHGALRRAAHLRNKTTTLSSCREAIHYILSLCAESTVRSMLRASCV